MVGASLGLQSFTQTRYDLQAKKIRQASSWFIHFTGVFTLYVAISRRSPRTRQVKEKVWHTRIVLRASVCSLPYLEARLTFGVEIECDGRTEVGTETNYPSERCTRVGVPPTRPDVFPYQLPPKPRRWRSIRYGVDCVILARSPTASLGVTVEGLQLGMLPWSYVSFPALRLADSMQVDLFPCRHGCFRCHTAGAEIMMVTLFGIP